MYCISRFSEKQDVGVYNAYVDFRQTKDLKLFIQSNERNQNFGEINTYLELCKVKQISDYVLDVIIN